MESLDGGRDWRQPPTPVLFRATAGGRKTWGGGVGESILAGNNTEVEIDSQRACAFVTARRLTVAPAASQRMFPFAPAIAVETPLAIGVGALAGWSAP